MFRRETSIAPNNGEQLGQVIGTGSTVYWAPQYMGDILDIAMRRPRVLWRNLPTPQPGESEDAFLHFGGERKELSGYREVNYPEWDAEKMESFPIQQGTVKSVVCIHTLDHLSSAAVQFWLGDMERLLEPGGVITIVVPHFMSTLAHECIEHKTQYGLKTFHNILGGGNDVSVDFQMTWSEAPFGYDIHWRKNLKVGFNTILALEERNMVLVTQLIKETN